MEDRHVKMGRKNSTRAALLALTILLASILAPLSLETSGDMPKDNFFQAIPGLEMPALDLRDLAYSTATGEWVFASSVGLYYYNPDAAYEDAWRLEAPDMDVLAVEPGPWGVAAVGRLGAEGMMLVERANYENGSVVQSGELDLANSVSATADAYGYASFEAPVGETIFQDDFEGGFSGQWTTSNAYLDSDAYGGNWAARIAVEASGSPISASLSTNQGTNTTFHSGYDLEEVLWTAEYDGNMHTVVKDVVPPPSGSGTIGDPYMIYNVWDLQNINNNLAAHYALANDIDATETVGWNGGAGFMPVGTGASRFTGSLDGRNYTITGLYISRPGTNYVGLFGSIGTAASLTYFGLKNAEITGNHYVGGIAGESDNGMISSIYTTGSITGNSRVGGVVGWNNNQANVNSCYSAGNATGTQAVGGLVGFNGWNSGISKSYATGNVRGNMEVGGLVGYTYIGTASNSYSRGTVTRHTGSTYTNLGGFMGENYQGKALNCYSTGRVTFEGAGDPTNKGFCGAVVTGGNYEMTGNFWDTQTSLQSTTAGGATGQSTSNMMTQSTFSGWDFATTWHMTHGVTYPIFQRQPLPQPTGSGTSGDPFLIYDVAGLQAMNNNLGAHYALANDIDASETNGWNGGAGFVPVGTSGAGNDFAGSLDGRNHTISGLHINRPLVDYVGLFGVLGSSGYVSNLSLTDAYITGRNYVGGIAGVNSGTIIHASSSGTVSGQIEVGGLVGLHWASLFYSHSTAQVTGTEDEIGGLVGYMGWPSTVIGCYATGDVSGRQYVGGLVGWASQGEMSNSYATGSVDASIDYAGGLAGSFEFGTLLESYSTGAVSCPGVNVGGLLGYSNGNTITSCYWDTQTSGLGTSPGGIGRTTTELLSPGTYIGWDFTNTWWIVNANTRPFLRVEWSPKIRTSHQLQLMAMDLTTDYVLAGDLNVSDISNPASMWGTIVGSTGGFVSVGNSSISFTGSFDGRNHTITGLYINRPVTNYVGLFGWVDPGSIIKNVGLVGNNITGQDHVGSLAGVNAGSTVMNCSSTGSVLGRAYVGGLVASVYNGFVEDSHSTGDVDGTGNQVGGLVGYAYKSNITRSYATGYITGVQRLGGILGSQEYGNISNSYSTGNVQGTGNDVGGFIGHNIQGNVYNSYSTGNATGDWYVGGFIGTTNGAVQNSYSTGSATGSMYVGGFVGYNNANLITNCFWDTIASGTMTGIGGGTNSGATGKTTTEMKTQSTFVGWDFTNIWHMLEGFTYPIFQWRPLDMSSAGIDYIRIVDTPNAGATILASGSVPLDNSIMGYAAGFNDTFGYVRDVDASWSLATGSVPGHMSLELNITGHSLITVSYARKVYSSSCTFLVSYEIDGGILMVFEQLFSTEPYSFVSYNLEPQGGSLLSISWYMDGMVGDSAWLDQVTITGFSPQYSPGDHIYFGAGETVSAGMVRVTPVPHAGGFYPSGSTVAGGEEDVGSSLNSFPANSIFMGYNSWSSPTAWSGMPYAMDLYYDADISSTISPGDVRLTPVKVFAHASGSADGVGSQLNAVASSEEHGVLAVGDGGVVVRYHYSGGQWVFSNPMVPMITAEHNLFAVAYTNGVWVVVGKNTTSNSPVAFALSSSLAYCEEINLPASNSLLLSAAGYDGIVLMVGENGRAVVYNTVSKVATGKITGTTQRFSSVRWKWEGTEAIVGGDLGQVHIYHRGSGSFHDVTNASFGADPIIAVGVKAPSSPGTAFLLRSTGGTRDVLGYSFDTPVTLDSPSAPQISHYDISVGGQSKKNSMVDAGSTLTFFIDGHYEGGWNNVEIWIEGWHDMGMEGLGSNPPHTPNLWDRNTYFNVSYRSATGWNLNFPNPATPLYPGWENEFQIADYNEAAAFEGDGYEHHYLWLNLTLGSQARAANPGAFNILGDLTPELGFANPNTWDVQMTMQAGGEATRRYTEFGIYKYMGLSVSGSPSGGNVPGEEAKLSPTSVVVVSNTPYSVTLEVSDLSHTLNPVWTIDAENIYVQNHQGERMEGVWTNYGDAAVKTNFLGPNQPLRIWGTDATPYLSPPGYGTTALGQHPGGSLSGQLELLESDPDVGLRLQTLLNASIDQPGEYSLGASAYIDKDLSGDVSTGDRRIFNSSFSSGSWVGDGDMDVGTELFPWSNAKVTGPDGIWDPATETVYDSQDDIAEAQDHRITTFHGFTTIDWWIYIPPGTQEGRYAGTAKLQIYFQP